MSSLKWLQTRSLPTIRMKMNFKLIKGRYKNIIEMSIAVGVICWIAYRIIFMIITVVLPHLQRKCGKLYRINILRKLVQRNTLLITSFAIKWWMKNLWQNKYRIFKWLLHRLDLKALKLGKTLLWLQSLATNYHHHGESFKVNTP